MSELSTSNETRAIGHFYDGNYGVKANRACDACRRRKIKCIRTGTQPCEKCTSAGLACLFNAIPQRKGPRAGRVKVGSKPSETWRRSHFEVPSHDSAVMPRSPAKIGRPSVLSMEMIAICVNYYFANLYLIQPVLRREEIEEMVGHMEKDIEASCLIMSLCSFVIFQPDLPIAFQGPEARPQDRLPCGNAVLREALRINSGKNDNENPTISSIITSFFFFASNFCLGRDNAAWFHLREATTLAQILGMHEEAFYQISDTVEASRNRRLYWLLFVAERAFALRSHRPVSLHTTIKLPALDEDPSEPVGLNGFIHMIKLFRTIDGTFVGLWNDFHARCPSEWLVRLQHHLSNAFPTHFRSTEIQAVDLIVSQQWLRTLVWQISMRQGFLSSTAADSVMRFGFPIEVSRELLTAIHRFSRQAMEFHGIGLAEKLFDLACTFIDVLYCVPLERHVLECRFKDDLNQLVSLISMLRTGRKHYLTVLLCKVSEVIPTKSAEHFARQITPSLSPMRECLNPENTKSQHQYQSSNQSSTLACPEMPPFESPPLDGGAHYGGRIAGKAAFSFVHPW